MGKFVKIRDPESGWEASVRLLDHNSIVHLEARIEAPSKVIAFEGAKWVMDMFGKGRECLIRCAPEADTFHNFDSKEDHHRGYVRFSFMTPDSNWQYPKDGPVKFVSIAEIAEGE